MHSGWARVQVNESLFKNESLTAEPQLNPIHVHSISILYEKFLRQDGNK